MKTKVVPKNSITRLYIAIWRNDLQEVIKIAEEDPTLVNIQYDRMFITPFHFSLYLKRTEIAETLLRDFDGDFTQEGKFFMEYLHFTKIRAAATAIDQQLDFLFRKYPEKVTKEVKEIINTYNSKLSISRFKRCMLRYDFKPALRQFELSSAISVRKFFKSDKEYPFLGRLLDHRNFSFFMKFVNRMKGAYPTQALEMIMKHLFNSSQYRTNLDCFKFLLEAFPNDTSEYSARIRNYLTDPRKIASDKFFKALELDDLNLFKEWAEENKVAKLSSSSESKNKPSDLYLAALCGAKSIVKYMVESKYDNNICWHSEFRNNRPTDAAFFCYNFDILRFLLSNCDLNVEEERRILQYFSGLFIYE